VSACAQKSAVLAYLTMAKLKMNRRVPNKNADLLKKKISLMGTEVIPKIRNKTQNQKFNFGQK